MVIITDKRDHEKNAVTSLLLMIFNRVHDELPRVIDVDIWTDEPYSQFKSKFMFESLWKLKYDFPKFHLRWNITANPHEKGPNDALGGTVK